MNFDKQFNEGIKVFAATCICGGVGLGIGISLAPSILTAIALGAVGAVAGGGIGFTGAAVAFDGPKVVISDLKKIANHCSSKFKKLLSPVKVPVLTNDATANKSVKSSNNDLTAKTTQNDFSNSATTEPTTTNSNENTAKPANKKQNTFKK